MAARDAVLAGVGVLVTRPAGQADNLVRAIEAVGGRAIRFPTLALAPPADTAPLDRLFGRLAEFDIAIFISPSAVDQGLRQLHQRGLALPSPLRVMAVGAGTAAALAAHGVAATAPTERFDSEALLALPALAQVARRRVIIFRGEGGRTLLGDTLQARGATVAYAECYRRTRPDNDAAPLRAHLARGDIDVISITSVAALENLCDMIGTAGRDRLCQLPVAVLNARQANACRRLGFAHEPLVAAQATDTALVQAMMTWAMRRE